MGFDPQWAFRDCKWCGAHDVQMQQSGHFMTSGASYPGARSWTALACPRCASLTIVERNADQMNPPELISVWPRDEDLKHEVDGLPDDIAEYFGNARKALAVGLPDSAAVELRRTLEAATAAYGADRGVLVRRVQKLIEDGHVTNVFEPALGYIRKIGNVAAHAGSERLSTSEVQQALTFTTLLLRNLFELPAQVKALEDESPPPSIEDPAEAAEVVIEFEVCGHLQADVAELQNLAESIRDQGGQAEVQPGETSADATRCVIVGSMSLAALADWIMGYLQHGHEAVVVDLARERVQVRRDLTPRPGSIVLLAQGGRAELLDQPDAAALTEAMAAAQAAV